MMGGSDVPLWFRTKGKFDIPIGKDWFHVPIWFCKNPMKLFDTQ